MAVTFLVSTFGGPTQMNDRMLYHGTQDEVLLGDRIVIKRWLRKDLTGVVCYIPGKSPKHKDLEYEDVQQWAIRLDDGTVLAMAYDPSHHLGQPKKDIRLVTRGEAGLLKPEDPLG